MNKIVLETPGSRHAQPAARWAQAPTGVTGNYLAECESLRGIAILLVILFHAYLEIAKTHPLAPNFLSGFIISGNTGVTLFFVLSGFLLNLPLLRSQKPSLAIFFRNRALRILPMYAIMVGIGAIYHRDIGSALQALLFWNINVEILWPFGSVWWSLMVEAQFYLLLPILYGIARSQRWRWLIVPVFCAGCFSYLLFTGRLPWKPSHFYFIAYPKNSILSLWPVFLCGGMLAWVHTRYQPAIANYVSKSRFFINGGSELIFFAILLALSFTLLKVSQVGLISAYVLYFDHVIVEAVLWTLLIAALLYLPLKTKLLLSNPVFAFFGLISYSLYLIHFPILFLGLKFTKKYYPGLLVLSKPALIAILLMIATALAFATYSLIEKPALRLKRRTPA